VKTYKDGRIEDGNYKDNKMHGKWKYYDAEG
jgi:antitoxin component YwqK of YwqJK toxin-antitoxin module